MTYISREIHTRICCCTAFLQLSVVSVPQQKSHGREWLL